ncbi:MAG: hypothetical protein QOE44_2509 [Solirubrobacteraceae bacterium]|nr:hypothetical protein [Solirubrobacteraceae bacterium]
MWNRTRRGRGSTATAAAVAAAASLVLAGCGLGAGGTPAGVQLTVTRDFGAAGLEERAAPAIRGKDTAMRLLERNAKVTTAYGGGFVSSIDGLAGGQDAGRPVDWFYYVNGIEASRGAAATTLHDGDHVWWDRHDWGTAMAVPAVVGSFPEPFLHGTGGKRLPVRVECIDPASPACSAVSHQLTRLGIPAARGGVGLSYRDESLRILVGAWPRMRDDPAARRLETGPSASGVYARMAPDGRSIVLLNARGAPVRTLGPGSGLVAATRFGGAPPVWIVTGTDPAGIAAAAQALEPGALHDRFALAVANDLGVPLPVAGR